MYLLCFFGAFPELHIQRRQDDAIPRCLSVRTCPSAKLCMGTSILTWQPTLTPSTFRKYGEADITIVWALPYVTLTLFNAYIIQWPYTYTGLSRHVFPRCNSQQQT
jgi:hypothetical protein